MRQLDTLIIHASATPEGRPVSVDTIRRWHVQKGWSDIGYHFVIGLEGTVSVGRDIRRIGAHVRGHNTGSIGICYIGGVTRGDMKPKDTRTHAQKAALNELIENLLEEYPTIRRVVGHRDFPGVAKACPCFNAIPEYMPLVEKTKRYAALAIASHPPMPPPIQPAFQSNLEGDMGGKRWYQSTTILAAGAGAVPGSLGAISAFTPWLAALAILLIWGTVLYILRERMKKSREYGI